MGNTLNIYQRLNKAKAEVSNVEKGEKTPGMKYRPMLHDEVTSATREVLMNNGIYLEFHITSRVQNGNRTELDGIVWFINIDDPKDRSPTYVSGYGIDEQDKGPGKAISYAFKYGLLKGLMLKTGDEPELDQKTEFKAPAESGPNKPVLIGRISTLLGKDEKRKSAFLSFHNASSFAEMSVEDLRKVHEHLSNERTNKEVVA